jgi:putative holliday junction resolvase
VTHDHPKRLLGIDFGSKRIGLALSDPTGTIATGYMTIQNDKSSCDRIAEIVDEKEVITIVIGLPISLKGGESQKTKEVRSFSSKLQQHVTVPVVFQDERFTSREAMATMIAMNTTQKQRRQKAKIDEIAAAIILQAYLDGEKIR